MKWNGCKNGIKIQNFWIANPLTYLAESEQENEPSAILDALPVAQHPFVDELGYWPSYARMTPAQRYEYLTWMSNGRHELPLELGYIFVFFYGLERRALVDGTDHRLVFEEVLRLRKMHESGAAKISQSFMSYSGSLLWLLVARDPGNYAPEQVRGLVLSPERWGAERSQAALTWAARHYEYLPPLLAFTLANAFSHAGSSRQLATITKDLQQLFSLRYHEKCQMGISLRPDGEGKVSLPVEHFTASAALKSFKYNVSLPKCTYKQVQQLGGLWDECVSALWSLATLTAKRIGQDRQLSDAERWEALPPALRTNPHPYREVIVSRVQPLLDQKHFAPVTLSALASDCQIQGSSGRTHWTKTECTGLVNVLDHCGLAVEPDYRITGKPYGASDTAIVFVPEPETVDSRKYQAACLMLRLGLLAASADGKVEKTELDIIASFILEAFSLNRAEQKRMRALAGLLLGTKIDMVSVKPILDLLTADQRQSTAKMLIAVTAADEVITPAEMKHLKSCFTRLGLGESLLASLLLQLQSSEVIQIIAKQATRNLGERIPVPPNAPGEKSLRLDKSAIATLLKETQDVQAILAQAISAEDESEEETLSGPELLPDPLPPAELSTTLPPLYAAFYRGLMQRTVWPQAEANALAHEHGHMLSGALEALNDWAVEQYGEPIFYEEGGQVVIESGTVAWV